MEILNGRLIFQKIVFDDNWAEEESLSNGISSVILCPSTVREFKNRWLEIKESGEPYTKELLEEIGKFKDFSFYVPDHRRVTDCDWLPIFSIIDYQKNAVIEMLNRRRLAVFFDTGTGKTVLTVEYLYNKLKGQSGRKVIIVTKSIVVPQFTHSIEKLPKEILDNNSIVVCSYDTAYKYVKNDFDIVFLDESHSVKNKGSLRYQDIKKLVTNKTSYAFLLTATPQDKSKFEAIVQLSILSPLVLHERGATAFKTRYWELNDYGSPKKERKDRIHEVNETLNQLSIACVADNVLDIPKMKKPILIDCYKDKDMTMYTTMLNPKIKAVEHDGITFLGNNISRQRSYLKQIGNGFLYEEKVDDTSEDIEDWKTHKVPHTINSNKIDEMRKVLKSGKFKRSIIFTFFDEDNRQVERLLNELGLSYRSVLRITRKKRDEIVKGFKEGEFDHLIIKYTSGGAGLDFEMVQTIQWFTIPEGWIDLKQGRGRIHRYGQKEEQQEYFYIGSQLDKDIYRTVAVKKKSYNDDTFKKFVNYE